MLPDKQESRRILVEIDRVLWEIWEPIRVNDEPMARDEYARYVGDIYELLISDKSDSDIQQHLRYITEVRIRVGKGDERKTISALRVISLTPDVF